MTARTTGSRRSGGLRGRRAQRGGAMVEFAILAPILVVLVLWSNYFWEVQFARIKAAEAVRFVAFERTVRPDLNAIVAEAQDRYQDLDGTNKGATLGSYYRNKLTVFARAELAPAPLNSSEGLSDKGSSAGVGSIIGAVVGALGGTAGAVAQKMGLDPNQGAVKAEVEFRLQNAIIPQEISFFTTGYTDNRLDITFKDQFYLYHDTWMAWGYGDNPNDTYARVQQHTYDRTSQIVYAGIASGPAGSVLNTIGTVLSVLGLDFPFADDYIQDSILLRPVGAPGYYPAQTPTRTMPGDQLQAAYWKDDDSYCFNSCEASVINQKRGFHSASDYNDNWPMRSYNCRGNFFQGAKKSELTESEYTRSSGVGSPYFNYGSNACQD